MGSLPPTIPNLCAYNIFMETQSVSFAANQPTLSKYKMETTLQCGKCGITNVYKSKGSPHNSCVREQI